MVVINSFPRRVMSEVVGLFARRESKLKRYGETLSMREKRFVAGHVLGHVGKGGWSETAGNFVRSAEVLVNNGEDTQIEVDTNEYGVTAWKMRGEGPKAQQLEFCSHLVFWGKGNGTVAIGNDGRSSVVSLEEAVNKRLSTIYDAYFSEKTRRGVERLTMATRMNDWAIVQGMIGEGRLISMEMTGEGLPYRPMLEHLFSIDRQTKNIPIQLLLGLRLLSGSRGTPIVTEYYPYMEGLSYRFRLIKNSGTEGVFRVFLEGLNACREIPLLKLKIQ
ncbi:hypothetical protein A3J90_02880 [candidate division WOR-1 bacterium RIFOXYC2_FULL_37_10]|uniref:Uncharacterized protein n=1 Tax=candidate division WOR-1 bacterium RIFOXYB2_FULL_37_13 TaxID=1802579 RepID=A0A1F4SPB8_UNCSA|nr:MAG: hypothetical protein A2310_01560 [candidate division WOR-1 bacterium RIFOXYB2_FULL_37_13]OGC34557.1 MAG: hypothetical protein A3J90_02880 [candidate division WOR-1 bacterium RIFOXYC2_FULL_37_10]